MSLPIYVSRNGVLIQPAQACVSVFNPAIYGAYGVYESMEVARGVVFAEDAHLQRLARSAALLDLALPADLSTFKKWIGEILAAHDAPECTLRLFVVGAERGRQAIAFIWPQPPITYPPHLYTVGAATITVPGQRFLPEAKSINTLVSYLARRKAVAAGAHEGLLVHDGYITEGANSNFFAVLRDEVITPPAELVLPGVTRDILIGLARGAGIAVREAPLALAGASEWTECFITSTSRHVMPVTRIDGRPVGSGAVGPVTGRLMALFAEHFERAIGHPGGAP